MRQKWMVFGATSDIAMATCLLRAAGNGFILVGRNEDALRVFAERLKECGAHSTEVHVLDFGDHQALLSFLSEFDSIEHPTHIMVAQGQLMSSSRALQDYKAASTMVVVNTLSTLTIMSWAASMNKVKWVVVLGSVAGDRGRADNFLYGATKAALNTFVDGALLMDRGPKWLLVKPGPVHSKMTKDLTPSALWTTPSTVAKTIDRQIDRGREGIIYSPWYWQIAMGIIRHLPSAIVRHIKN